MSVLFSILAYTLLFLLAVASVYSVGLWAWLSWSGGGRGASAHRSGGPTARAVPPAQGPMEIGIRGLRGVEEGRRESA